MLTSGTRPACSSDGVAGPVGRVGAEQPQVVPEQAGHADGGVGTVLDDGEPETAGVGGAQFLPGVAAHGHALHDHVVAVDDLTGVPGGRVVWGAGPFAGGGVDVDRGGVRPDAQVADVGEAT